jgi:hypothetical protein
MTWCGGKLTPSSAGLVLVQPVGGTLPCRARYLLHYLCLNPLLRSRVGTEMRSRPGTEMRSRPGTEMRSPDPPKKAHQLKPEHQHASAEVVQPGLTSIQHHRRPMWTPLSPRRMFSRKLVGPIRKACRWTHRGTEQPWHAGLGALRNLPQMRLPVNH